MQNPRLAHRYAKSLFDLAVERNELESTFNDMQTIKAICKSSPEFVSLLKSPIIKSDKKENIINSVISGKVGQITQLFSTLITQKGRENVLPEIANAFIEQFQDAKNIQRVSLTTAVELSESEKAAIINKVKAEAKIENIDLVTKVDESLIGGFVVEVGGKLVDASIARDLKDIKAQFLNNDFVHKIR